MTSGRLPPGHSPDRGSDGLSVTAADLIAQNAADNSAAVVRTRRLHWNLFIPYLGAMGR
jgi:hypothetical protein